MPYASPRHNANKARSNKKQSNKAYNKYKRTGHEFYHSTAWKKLRARFVIDNPLCISCKAKGIIKPVEIVDHIHEIKDGGAPLDASNLQSLCRACHNTKTFKKGSQG